jgi:hypothetical protein
MLPPLRPVAYFFFWHLRRPTRRCAGGGRRWTRRRIIAHAATPCHPMSVSGPPPPAAACDAGAPGAPEVGKAARVNADARLGSRVLSNRPRNFPPPLIYFEDISSSNQWFLPVRPLKPCKSVSVGRVDYPPESIPASYR